MFWPKSHVRPLGRLSCATLIGAVLGLGPGMAVAVAAPGEGPGSVIILVDASGSMKEPAGDGGSRMDAAKKGLDGVIKALPDDASVGLRAYGSTIEDGKGSCKDTELLVPVEPVDRPALSAGVKKLTPLGNTPIAYSLTKAAKDLPSDGPRSIVLVSDGEENCGGDPCEVARKISDSGTELTVDVVGLQVDTKSRNQLTCIASAGGGTYYDVPDAKNLPKTLTRVSVRAARGYKPAGEAVEGGTSAANAEPIVDGQWLDTIGDSGTENYRVLDPGKGTLHVAATVRPVGLGTADGVTATLNVSSKSGAECGLGARANAIGLMTKNSPITASYTLTAADRQDCGAGPYTVGVAASNLTDVKPLEVLVRSEAGVKTTTGLPAAAADNWEVPAVKTGSESNPVIGSPSFSSAPALTPGTYTDTVLGAETLFYAVDVDWGQQLVCDVTVGANPAADPYGVTRVEAQTYGFLRGRIQQPAGDTDSAFYESTKDAKISAVTPEVRYLNRTASSDSVKAAAKDGTYYCAVFVNAQPTQIEGLGEIPLTITVGVQGVAGAGAPAYKEKPESAKKVDDEAADTAGSGKKLAVLAGIAAGLVLLAGLVWAYLRRSRSTA